MAKIFYDSAGNVTRCYRGQVPAVVEPHGQQCLEIPDAELDDIIAGKRVSRFAVVNGALVLKPERQVPESFEEFYELSDSEKWELVFAAMKRGGRS